MDAQYDAIAEHYQRSKDSALRRCIEQPTFFALTGDVEGLRVLDLACGDGFYSRELAARGAQVTGVDVSPAMIHLAREAEAKARQGIEYFCADAASLPQLGLFDLVTAAYLLHYAIDLSNLQAICASIANCLRPGGRFVTINENPAQPAETNGRYAAYGFSKDLAEPLSEGARIVYRMLTGRESFSFHVHWYSQDSYDQALTVAGFASVEWQPLVFDTASDPAIDAQYFSAYLRHPPVTGLACRR